MRDLAQSQVAIVGLGLMGGSLGGALKDRCGQVVGVARRAESIDQALARDLIGRGTSDLAAGVGEADIVVLATPVRVILQQLTEIGPLLKAGCLVMDLGSTKCEIVDRMEGLPQRIEPLGAHPMCGKEVAGIAAAEITLYEGCTFVLTPLQRTSQEAVDLGRQLVQAVGGRPLILDAERHDQLVGAVSHLPYIVSCALVAAAAEAAAADPLVWQLAASGYRDASRLAASDVTMMLDILLTNRDAVLEAVSTCEEQLEELARMLREGDEQGLRAALSAVRESRVAWERGRSSATGEAGREDSSPRRE